MKLGEQACRKADPMLREFLEQAEGHEQARVILLLEGAAASEEPEPSPAGFASRAEYQQELIRRRQGVMRQALSGVHRKLEELELTPRGGSLSRSTVVEGAARQILESLELPAVRHASLDRAIELERPERDS